MIPAPLSKVIGVVAKITSYSPQRNRSTIVELINDVMGMLYRTEALRLNYCQAQECTLVRSFTEYCRNPCPAGFLGIVIPPGISNIREIRVNDLKYDITHERVSTGCVPGLGYPFGVRGVRTADFNCNPKAEKLKPRFFEYDIPSHNDNRVITFRSSTPEEDNGKTVGMRYINGNGHEVREDLVLGTTTVSTSQSVIEFLQVSFPERRGWMIAETAQGCPLGRYHPSIYQPIHDWYRLQRGCAGQKAEFRGIQEPIPYVFDSDMVPFSDATLWVLAIRAFQHLGSMELDSNQVSALARIYSQLSAVTNEDLKSKEHNFTTRLLPDSDKAMKSTGRYFARNK